MGANFKQGISCGGKTNPKRIYAYVQPKKALRGYIVTIEQDAAALTDKGNTETALSFGKRGYRQAQPEVFGISLAVR